MPAMCKICLSPYREELMRAWNNHFPRKMLYEKYKPLIWRGSGVKFVPFQQAIYKHRNHKNPGVVIVQTTNGSVGKDTQGIAKMFTELMSRKLETLNPQDITVKDYVAVNRLVLEEKKLNLDEKAQLLELAKIFGIPDIVEPIIEDNTAEPIIGEEKKDAELGPPKNEGDQPTGTQ